MAKEVKVLSLNNLNRREIDIIEDITNTELHWWKRNKDGGLDLYYDDYDVMGDCKEKKTFTEDNLIACSIISLGILAAILFSFLFIKFKMLYCTCL